MVHVLTRKWKRREMTLMKNIYSSCLEWKTRFFILVERRSVGKVESPDQTKHSQKNPSQEVVAKSKGQAGSLSWHPVVHQSHSRAAHHSCQSCCSRRRNSSSHGWDVSLQKGERLVLSSEIDLELVSKASDFLKEHFMVSPFWCQDANKRNGHYKKT